VKTMQDLLDARADRSPLTQTKGVNDDQTSSNPLDVMETKCSTCPWRVDNGVLCEDVATKDCLKSSVLTVRNQLCHSPAWIGMPETRICRGARDYQLQVFHRIGFLSEPTDQSWADKLSDIRVLRGDFTTKTIRSKKPKGFGKYK
jgi:hypothetical protein